MKFAQTSIALLFASLPAFARVSPKAARAAATTLQTSLFPSAYKYSSGFTTAAGISLSGVTTTTLSDSSLNVIKVSSGLTHNVVQQDGKTAWQAIYPEGSYNPDATPRGGIGFYVNGTDAFLQRIQDGATEVMFGYSLMFQEGWEWNMGGKLPGGYGGVGASAYECSGGRQDDREECFDLRLMWRTDGLGELYTYLPLTAENSAAQLSVPPLTIENTDYGFSVGRGAFTFPAGQWATVAERIKLNDPALYNGEIDIWFNGALVINVTGVSMRNSSDSVVQGMHFQSFFGGSTSDWASPQNQTAWFADVSGAIINS